MKTFNILTIILITLFAYIIMVKQDTIINKCNDIEHTLKTIILTQSVSDSLFLVHYSKCSFISNDRIKVGYDGYLKLKEPYDK